MQNEYDSKIKTLKHTHKILFPTGAQEGKAVLAVSQTQLQICSTKLYRKSEADTSSMSYHKTVAVCISSFAISEMHFYEYKWQQHSFHLF